MLTGNAIGPIQPPQFTTGVGPAIFHPVPLPILAPIYLTVFTPILSSVHLPIFTAVGLTILTAVLLPVGSSILPPIFLAHIIGGLSHDRTVMAVPSSVPIIAVIASAIHRAWPAVQ
jgi:hypothetical protein